MYGGRRGVIITDPLLKLELRGFEKLQQGTYMYIRNTQRNNYLIIRNSLSKIICEAKLTYGENNQNIRQMSHLT